MLLEPREKELAAIGASIGCTCRPCAEHHIPAGREAGLSETELADAVAIARAIRDDAISLLSARVDELLGGAAPASGYPATVADSFTSRDEELVALGASIGANSHPLLRRHLAAAHEVGLSSAQVAAAAKTAAYVQRRAAEITAEKTRQVLMELGAGAASAR